MKRSKLKFLVILMTIISMIFVAGCSNNKAEVAEESSKKVIYTTFFPVHDLTLRIVGDKMEVKSIITGNQEPHDFEIQASEMVGISESDLIIYNGAGMEGFIEDLKELAKNDDKFLDLSQGLTLLESHGEEHEHEEHEEHDEHDEHDEHEHNHSGVNPHTWLSIKNAQIELDTIYQKVASIDPENEAYYKANLEKSLEEFKALDEKFENEIAKISDEDKYFVVAHAAFNYLANDYGLKQIAVTGISPEDEPSAQQLKTIADFVAKHNITTVFFEGKATPKVAETLAENTNTKTSTLYTMESLTEEEMQMGYLKLMEKNLEELVKSFNE